LLPTTLHDRLQEFIRTFFDQDELVLTDDLIPADVPGWDSIAHVNLVFSIEEEFRVQFSDSELETFSTVGALERTLRRKLGD